jgi:2-oxoglutarate ferredoxin oxidoreductase subunit alpha
MREPVELPDFKTVQAYETTVSEPAETYKAFRNVPDGVPPLAPFGTGYRYHITGLYHDEVGFPTQRLDEIEPWLERVNTKLDKHLDEICLLERDEQPGARTAVLSYGASARTARHAVKMARAAGRKVSLDVLLTVWPFPEAQVEALGESVDRIVVPEMNLGQLALEVERIVGRRKVRRVTRANGEMVTPQMVLDAMEE